MRIFQRGFNYSQDGPGNRLVYHLSGCDLRCPWCCNPEGLSGKGGAEYSVADLLDEALRCRMMFFDGGGVTLTGGEFSLQFSESAAFLSALRDAGIPTAVETNGLSPRLPELFPVIDHLIMDVKHHDPETHRRVTGKPNEVLFQNIEAALRAGKVPALRIPLIGGFNDSNDDAAAYSALFSRFQELGRFTVEILPYHEFGKGKYRDLGLPYLMDEHARISPDRLTSFSGILRSAGIPLIHT